MRQMDSGTQQLAENILAVVEASRGTNCNASSRTTPPLYWRVGKRLNDVIGTNAHLEDAQRTIGCVADAVATRYGQEFSRDALLTMTTFAERFPDYEKVVTLSRDLTWEHFEKLIPIADDIKRDFYSWLTLVKKWDVKTLAAKIKAGVYEKTPSVAELEGTDRSKHTADDYETALMSALVSRDPDLMAYLKIDDSE